MAVGSRQHAQPYEKLSTLPLFVTLILNSICAKALVVRDRANPQLTAPSDAETEAASKLLSAEAPGPLSSGPILMCEYKKADQTLSHPQHGLHKEPDRVFSFSNWEADKHGRHDWGSWFADIGDKLYGMIVGGVTAIGLSENNWFPPFPRHVNHQRERLISLQKIWAVTPLFFTEMITGQEWWMSSGSLIGTVRSSGTIPWDTDGDLAVDMNGTFNTAETFQTLLKYAGGDKANWTRSKECKQHGGKCLVVPLPKSVDPSGDIVLVTHILPAKYDWIGRFVDLKTGFFVEIIDQGQFGNLVYPLQQCLHDGILVNAPNSPGKYLQGTGQYSDSDFNYGDAGEETVAVYLHEYSCQRCESFQLSREKRSSKHGHVRDNFQLSLMNAGNVSGKESWVSVDSADVASTTKCVALSGSAKPAKLDLRTACSKPNA